MLELASAVECAVFAVFKWSQLAAFAVVRAAFAGLLRPRVAVFALACVVLAGVM